MKYLKKNINDVFLFLHQLKHIDVSDWAINSNTSLENKALQRQKR